MSQLLNNLKSITKNISSTMYDLIKNDPSKRIVIGDLINQISLHQNTRHSQVYLLGLVFQTFSLSVDSFDFKLETKGINNEQLLEFIVRKDGITLFSYKGFEYHKNSLVDEIKIPESIYHTLV